MRLTGLRGVGKTVLLGEFERIATDAGWVVISSELSTRHNREDALIGDMVGLGEELILRLSKAERLKRAVGKAVRGIARVSVTYEDVKFTYEPGITSTGANLGKTLLKAVNAAVEKGRNGIMLL